MKILLVDDEPDIRTIAELGLRAVGGHVVVMAANGHDACVMALAAQPDVVLLDMMMPGMDGLATFDKLKHGEKTAHLPVIFVTAKVQKSEVAHYLALGAKGVISKPFDPMTLAHEVSEIMSGRAK